MLSTKLFNIRLYLEGLKRLKVIGTAVAILSVTVSALIPLMQWLSMSSHPPIAPESIAHNQLCIPLLLTVFLAPFFFFVLFSFLHKRKQSDFFHAIPYTRTCVYLSFVAAALSFVFVIQIGSALSAGLIWALNPHTTFKMGELISLILICILAAAEISGIMMLALSLTGTGTTTILMCGLFTFLARMILFYLSACIDTRFDIVSMNSVPFLSFSWFMPFGLFPFFINGHDDLSVDPFRSPANIIYTLVVTLLLFTAAWFFFKRRKSEMAGNTAPNRLTQHIFRCLFALPFVLLIPMFLLMGDATLPLYLALIVLTLLVYYLYELITTKRLSGMGKATLWLPALVVACLLFSGAYTCVEEAIFRQTPDSADEVVSVQMDTSSAYLDWDAYQQLLLEDCSSKDRALIEQIIDAMNKTVECDRLDDYALYYADYTESFVSFDRNWIQVDMTLTNGKTISRRVCFRADTFKQIETMYIETADLSMADFWSLPELSMIDTLRGEYFNHEGYLDYVWFTRGDKTQAYTQLYATLLEEYEALTDEQKNRLRVQYASDLWTTHGESEGFDLFISFTKGAHDSELHVSVFEDLLPRTYEILYDHLET